MFSEVTVCVRCAWIGARNGLCSDIGQIGVELWLMRSLFVCDGKKGLIWTL